MIRLGLLLAVLAIAALPLAAQIALPRFAVASIKLNRVPLFRTARSTCNRISSPRRCWPTASDCERVSRDCRVQSLR